MKNEPIKIITLSAPNGATIDVCQPCSIRQLPRNRMGQEYAQVSRGLHAGSCDVCGAGIIDPIQSAIFFPKI